MSVLPPAQEAVCLKLFAVPGVSARVRGVFDRLAGKARLREQRRRTQQPGQQPRQLPRQPRQAHQTEDARQPQEEGEEEEEEEEAAARRPAEPADGVEPSQAGRAPPEAPEVAPPPAAAAGAVPLSVQSAPAVGKPAGGKPAVGKGAAAASEASPGPRNGPEPALKAAAASPVGPASRFGAGRRGGATGLGEGGVRWRRDEGGAEVCVIDSSDEEEAGEGEERGGRGAYGGLAEGRPLPEVLRTAAAASPGGSGKRGEGGTGPTDAATAAPGGAPEASGGSGGRKRKCGAEEAAGATAAVAAAADLGGNPPRPRMVAPEATASGLALDGVRSSSAPGGEKQSPVSAAAAADISAERIFPVVVEAVAPRPAVPQQDPPGRTLDDLFNNSSWAMRDDEDEEEEEDEDL